MAASVGFIGVGNMGNPMAGNVLKQGFALTVFDLHAPAMDNLVQAGAKRGASAQAVVESCDIVLTCLPASPDVEALYLSAGGLIERAKPGNVLVDLSSVLPSTPKQLEAKARERGVHFLAYGCRLLGEFKPALSEEHTEFGLHALTGLEKIALPAGYARSIKSWSMYAES